MCCVRVWVGWMIALLTCQHFQTELSKMYASRAAACMLNTIYLTRNKRDACEAKQKKTRLKIEICLDDIDL